MGVGHPSSAKASAVQQVQPATADALYIRAKLTDVEWVRLRGRFDEARRLEARRLCGVYRTVACVVGEPDLPLEARAARFPT